MAIVRKYRGRVAGVRQVLPDIYTATFEALDRPFDYRPGQFLHLALDPYDAARPWPESRCFSIQTPPAEGRQALAITFATKGAFTRRMAQELAPGREVWLKMPYGDLFDGDWPARPCVFIAGGTGLTPFLSLFLDEAFSRFARAWLYLGLRSPGYHVFASEIDQAQRQNPVLAVETFFEDSQGYVPIDRVHETHGRGAVYFLSGPGAMIAGFRARLLLLGVAPGDVRSDDWQ